MSVDEWKAKLIDLFRSGRATDKQWEEMAYVLISVSDLSKFIDPDVNEVTE